MRLAESLMLDLRTLTTHRTQATLTPKRVPSSIPAFLGFLENVVRFDFDLGGVAVTARATDDGNSSDDGDDGDDGNHDTAAGPAAPAAAAAESSDHPAAPMATITPSIARDARRKRQREAAKLPLGPALAAMLYSERSILALCYEYADVLEKAQEGDATWQRQSLWLRLGDVEAICELPAPLMALMDVPPCSSSSSSGAALDSPERNARSPTGTRSKQIFGGGGGGRVGGGRRRAQVAQQHQKDQLSIKPRQCVR